MNGLFEGHLGVITRAIILGLGAGLTLFLLSLTIQIAAGLPFIGADIAPSATITLSGTGEAYSIPDIGTFSYSVVSLKNTVAEAQKDATQKSNDISAYLKESKIDAKDIKTTNYSISPQYEWREAKCAVNIPCPNGKQVLTGYEVRQSTEIKVRDTSKAGDLLVGVGTRGATEVSELSFTVEHPEAVKAEARNNAIADAKDKAQVLAHSLGVSLVRVIAFSESNNGYPVPMYGMERAVTMSADTASVAPQISVGQNKTESNVSVIYEIR